MSNIARTVGHWSTIFSKQLPPNSSLERIADRIISDLWGYRHNSRYRRDDVISLANAITACEKKDALGLNNQFVQLVTDLCAVIPQDIPVIHAPNCAEFKPKYDDNRPYPEMGECDCNPISADLTEDAKARGYDRIREILYPKDQPR